MRRRSFLAALSVTGSGFVAGCGSLFGSGTPEPERELDGTLTPAPVPNEPTRTTVTGTGRETATETPPAPTGSLSVAQAPDIVSPDKFAGWDLPSLDVDDADRVLRYDRPDADRGAIVLGPTAVSVASDETLGFVLLNREGRPVTLNPYTWQVLGNDEGGGWHTVTVGTARPVKLRVVRGGAYVWTGVRRYSPESSTSFPHGFPLMLSPGRYVFTVAGVYSPGTNDATRVRFVSPFEAVE